MFFDIMSSRSRSIFVWEVGYSWSVVRVRNFLYSLARLTACGFEWCGVVGDHGKTLRAKYPDN
jgi:hypothetical protein